MAVYYRSSRLWFGDAPSVKANNLALSFDELVSLPQFSTHIPSIPVHHGGSRRPLPCTC